MMRSSYPSMLKNAKRILEAKKSSVIEKKLAQLKEMIELIKKELI